MRFLSLRYFVTLIVLIIVHFLVLWHTGIVHRVLDFVVALSNGKAQYAKIVWQVGLCALVQSVVSAN